MTYDVGIVSLLENITLQVDEAFGESEVLGDLSPVLLGGVLGDCHDYKQEGERKVQE